MTREMPREAAWRGTGLQLGHPAGQRTGEMMRAAMRQAMPQMMSHVSPPETKRERKPDPRHPSPPRPAQSGAAPAPAALDLLCDVPVPLRMRFADDLTRHLAAHRASTGEAFSCQVPVGQGGASPFDHLRRIRALEAFPRMLVSARQGNAFNRRFHAAHVAGGAFASAQPEGVAPVFEAAGLVDPRGWIGVYAVAPFVMLVDRVRLGTRPLPRSWTDLAEPEWRGEVSFGGWRRPGARHHAALNTFFLLAMLRLIGPDRLVRLLANVPALTHSAQMPRIAGTGASVAAVYVVPWSLADICPRRARTAVVWPREGALAYPLWSTVQAAQRGRVAPLLDHLHGTATADFLDRNRYPALAPGRRPGLPEGARLVWPGWDYARHPAAARDLKQVVALFQEGRAQRSGEERRCA
ncbi:ABC transporter substrate-binding protein [Xanthobacter sp. V4C-4]|uniref:ABC transporter substrate-binding protein n=1 Tax=Xanthobacter cornucopiae TaxID=3119924 RepID=UPI00372C53D8